MKTLILVRHGKSSWDYEVSDKDRPLLERGIRDAHLVSAAYKEYAENVDMVYSSPAIRALSSCMIFLRSWDFPVEDLIISESLYDFSGESVKKFASQLDDSLETVALFGHNFAFTELVNFWGSREIENVPTNGLVELRFDTLNWNNLQHAETSKILFPKKLRKV